MELYQVKSKTGKTYIIFRFFDVHNNNFEYPIYKLVKSKPVAREFDIPDKIEGRKSELNTREMCDKLIQKIKDGQI